MFAHDYVLVNFQRLELVSLGYSVLPENTYLEIIDQVIALELRILLFKVWSEATL